MLFKQIHLQGIKAGEISLAFRKWKNPLVKKGSIIKSSVGQLEIKNIVEVKQKGINQNDAEFSGYKNLTDLIETLNSKSDGNIYKIYVKYHSRDPRKKLSEQSVLSDEDFINIKMKLERFDNYSKQGNWTLKILTAIQSNPKLKAQDLAEKLKLQKDWLKVNVRKLKNLGLTISHEKGYTISPSGNLFLDRLSE